MQSYLRHVIIDLLSSIFQHKCIYFLEIIFIYILQIILSYTVLIIRNTDLSNVSKYFISGVLLYNFI